MSIDSNCYSATKLIVAMMSFVVSLGVNATDAIRLSGFANLGATYSDSDKLEFRNTIINSPRDGVSFAADSVLGLQVNAQLNEKLDGVGQVVIQDRNDHSAINYLELAFLRYQFNRSWSVKAGRFSLPSYLFTDYRYVGHALTWVRAPLEMYSVVGSISTMNGLQTNFVTDADFGVVKVGLSYGAANFQNDLPEGKFRFNYEDLAGINVELQSTNWRAQAVLLTAVYDDMRFPNIDELRASTDLVPPIFQPFAQQVVDQFIPDGTRVRYLSMGATYYHEGFEIIAEVGDFQSDWALSSDSRFGYVSLSYNIDTITPYVVLGIHSRGNEPEIIDYDAARAALPPFAFQQLEALLSSSNETVRGNSTDQRSISLGLRWDFSTSWSLKAQFDHIKTSEYGSGLFSIKPGILTPQEELNYNVANVSFTTTF